MQHWTHTQTAVTDVHFAWLCLMRNVKNKSTHSHETKGPHCCACWPHGALSMHGSPYRRACSSENSPSSNLAVAQWEFPIVKSPHWLQWDAPYLSLKLPLPVDRYPDPTTCLIQGPVRPAMPKQHPDPIRRFPTTNWTDRP